MLARARARVSHARLIELTASDQAELERLQRSTVGPAGPSRRARVVLLLAGEKAGAEVARLKGHMPVQISRIRRRFVEEGLSGLIDRPRPGHPPQLREAKRARIVALTLKELPKGLMHWSSREIGERVGVSHATVHRIWQAHALQPHRVEIFKFTVDPQAEAKIHDVVGLYLNPPTNAVVLCVDEKTQCHALERTHWQLPLRPNLQARQTHDYHRHGLTSLYAAFEVTAGRVLGECSERHTGADLLRFLKGINRRYRGRELHVILDNSSTHSTPEIRAWLEKHPHVCFHFTPTGASWLNMVEAWFGILARKSVRRGSFISVKALVRHIGNYIEHWNAHPTPFVWTKAPETIIRKVVRRGH